MYTVILYEMYMYINMHIYIYIYIRGLSLVRLDERERERAGESECTFQKKLAGRYANRYMRDSWLAAIRDARNKKRC